MTKGKITALVNHDGKLLALAGGMVADILLLLSLLIYVAIRLAS